jgi:hypothetical protein
MAFSYCVRKKGRTALMKSKEGNDVCRVWRVWITQLCEEVERRAQEIQH